MTAWHRPGIERAGYINRVRLHGYVASSTATDEYDYPDQLEVQIGLWYPGGKTSAIQPAIFLSPHPTLVEAARRSEGKWTHMAGRVLSDTVNGELKTWVLGTEIQFSDVDYRPVDLHENPYLNSVTLHGFVATLPGTRQVDSIPLQLSIQVGIWMQGAQKSMAQSAIFIDPPAALVEEAMASEGRSAHVKGRVASVIVDGDWETRVIGSTVRFMDATYEPLNRDY